MAEYYLAIITRDAILKDKDAKGGQMTEETMAMLMANDKLLESKAEKGLGQALYTFGKDLYRYLQSSRSTKTNRRKLQQAHDYLVESVKKGVHSAYFFLGVMAMEGIYLKKDPELGIEYLVKGAAQNNAYCFYYLSMLYNEGVYVEKNPRLEFLYLKRAAEEGFVQM